MDERMKQKLFQKNQALIDMVIERAKRDFPEDIAVIGLSGSFSTGDYHEKSDLDLIIINNTDRGWDISHCFILDDVGYDIYCTPWDTRIKDQAELKSPHVSCLLDMEVLYYSTPEDLERLHACQKQAADELAKPLGSNCLHRAAEKLNLAKQEYTNTVLTTDINEAKTAAGNVLHCIVNALTDINNTRIQHGIKRYLHDTLKYKYLPDHYETLFLNVTEAETLDEIRSAALALISAVNDLLQKMRREFLQKPVPTAENLRGTYEEFWCNCRNKVLNGIESGDKAYAFLAAHASQGYADEMHEMFGTPKFSLLEDFHSNDPESFREIFLTAMDEYLNEYKKVGLNIQKYNTIDQLYADYMKQK